MSEYPSLESYYEREFDYDKWYTLVPDHSDSIIVQLSLEETQALFKQIKPFEDVKVDLPSVQKKIDEVVVATPWFIKLTSLSPKDSSNCKCTTSLDALKILCESDIIYHEVEDALSEGRGVGIVVQRWKDEIRLERELRLFIFNKRLVAVSAYDESCTVVIDSKVLEEYVSEKLREVPYDDYVCDVCVLESKIVLIELNPYGELSDPVLFDWTEDREILYSWESKEVIVRTNFSEQ